MEHSIYLLYTTTIDISKLERYKDSEYNFTCKTFNL